MPAVVYVGFGSGADDCPLVMVEVVEVVLGLGESMANTEASGNDDRLIFDGYNVIRNLGEK